MVWERSEAADADLIGVGALAALLGVSEQAALRYTQRDDFPHPLTPAGPVWSREEVESWLAHEPAREVSAPLAELDVHRRIEFATPSQALPERAPTPRWPPP